MNQSKMISKLVCKEKIHLTLVKDVVQCGMVIEQAHIYFLECLGSLGERLDHFDKSSVFYSFCLAGVSGKFLRVCYILFLYKGAMLISMKLF